MSVHTSFPCLSDESARLIDFCDFEMPTNLWKRYRDACLLCLYSLCVLVVTRDC